MDPGARAELEQRVRDAVERGDVSSAVTSTLEGYGLTTFAWESTLRTWVYAIARNIMRANRRKAARRERRVARVGDSAIEAVAAKVRTETLTFLRTEQRTRVQALRDALPEEDRILLILRIDRQLAWDELARVMAATGPGGALDNAAVTKESARLRKRFQLVKERLREHAKREGLLE